MSENKQPFPSTQPSTQLKNPIKTSLAVFTVTEPPKPPKNAKYVLYGKADVDLEWKGYIFRLERFTWRVYRNSGKIIVIFPNQSYPDRNSEPGHKLKKYTVPTFTVVPEEGYRDIYHDIIDCIQDEVKKRFNPLINEYMQYKGVPNMYGKVFKKDWFLRPHYDQLRAAERERWGNPPPYDAPDPIDVEVIEIYEDPKCQEGKSTKRYAIKGTAHINLKLDGYTFEIRNLFWGIKHVSYKVKVKAPPQLHLTQKQDPTSSFITLGFRPFTPEGNRDLQLKILDIVSFEILNLYSEDIEKRKPEFHHAYEAIQSDVKRRRRLALYMKKKKYRKVNVFP